MPGTISFPSGIPAFESHREWVFAPHANHPTIGFLRSLASPDLQLILVSAPAIDDAYELALEPWDRESLEAQDASDLATYFVVCLQGDGATVNMLAPIVIDHAAQRGVQAVRADRKYTHSAPLIRLREAQPC